MHRSPEIELRHGCWGRWQLDGVGCPCNIWTSYNRNFNVFRFLCRADTFRRQSDIYAASSKMHSIIIPVIMAHIGMVGNACIDCTCHTASSNGVGDVARFIISIHSAVGHSGHLVMRSASSGGNVTARLNANVDTPSIWSRASVRSNYTLYRGNMNSNC